MARRRIGVECGIAEPRSGGSPTPEAPVGADVGRALSSLAPQRYFHTKSQFLQQWESTVGPKYRNTHLLCQFPPHDDDVSI